MSVPVGDRQTTIKVGSHAKASLQTKDATEARRRFVPALAAVEAHWEALRRGPTKLNHKQCVALAGEIRSLMVDTVDDDPGSPELWQRVAALDAEAKRLRPLLQVSSLGPPVVSNKIGLEQRFGSFADFALRRRGLIVDEGSRSKLIHLVANVMEEAAAINLRKAMGDYSPDGDAKKYPAFRPNGEDNERSEAKHERTLTFTSIIDEEKRRRSLGKECNPIPDRTVKKFQNAAEEFAEFRGSADARTVSAEEVEGWKLNLLEEGELTNNTIAQRLQNLSTIMAWGQQHTLGKLFQHQNPVNVVKRPEKSSVRSEDRTLRLEEARAILRAARKETKSTLRWLPWLMAYSGARVSEVAQLLPKDFFEVEGKWFYVLTNKGRKTLKNTHSVRRVPIHQDLQAEGLLEFVERHRDTPEIGLFKRSAQQDLSDWVRGTAGVTRPDAAPSHGWRHLFEDMAMDAGMMNSAKLYITGRSSGRSADGYGKSDAMLPALAREMQKMRSYLTD